MNFIRKYFICNLILLTQINFAQELLKGKIFAGDSISSMPFVYLFNKSSGSGTMSDNEGRFTIQVNSNDTLVCSFLGYRKLIIPVKKIAKDKQGNSNLIMNEAAVNLNAVVINSFTYKPYERQYMQDIIARSRIKNIDYARSPITALYMKYSREGKQINKLAKIFESIMIEEQVQKKLSKEILMRLTGDDKIDYIAFRKYCYYVGDYYIVSHDGVELYSKVMECYRKYKREIQRD